MKIEQTLLKNELKINEMEFKFRNWLDTMNPPKSKDQP